ncbi:VWA domain-containing protein [Clostridium sp.]|uniref:VWA domain-containing protein n=1 Tax=Clostridium sp. TaxID=1506 RepID=UPI003F3A7EA1
MKKFSKVNKGKIKKIGSLTLAIILVLGLILVPSNIAMADDIKPQIDVNFLGISPKNPMQGQEIEVTYEILPHPFQHNVSKPKEIVLVLDGSGSMEGTRLTNLKKAAIAFIDRLKNVDNLKVGIVVYSSEATINPIKYLGSKTVSNISGNRHSVPNYSSISDEYLIDIKDSRLNTMINNIRALGGTNTGEGLRKAEYLLSKGDKQANKSIVFMSDGLPTFYSVNSKNNTNYYTKIDNNNPAIAGTGSESSNSGVNSSTNYATTIGNIIKESNYNIFSIGYGLGNSTSTGNKKMQEIHKSMGGVVNLQNPNDSNNTFFASDEGAIDSIFNKIADKLQQQYSFNDANLQINLGDSFTATEGFEVSGVGGSIIKVPPIIYNLTKVDGVDTYMADPIIIKFKIRANKVGEYPLFNSDSKLQYTDINGNKVSVDLENPMINVKEFTVEDSKKLQVDFYPEKNGYLIGDKANVIVNFIHPGTNGITFNNAIFDITEGIPSVLDIQGSSPILEFGTIGADNPKQQYNFNILDINEVNTSEATSYDLNGKYSYSINQGNSAANIEENDLATINVKRGSVRVKVIDTKGNIISNNIEVELKGNSINQTLSGDNSSELIFDGIPTGNYEMKLTQVPTGYEPVEGNSTVFLLDYNNNLVEYTFILEGSSEEVSISVSDSSGTLEKQYNTSNNSKEYFIKDNWNEDYKLYGTSDVEFNFRGNDYSKLRYRFINIDNELGNTQWKIIDNKTSDVNLKDKESFINKILNLNPFKSNEPIEVDNDTFLEGNRDSFPSVSGRYVIEYEVGKEENKNFIKIDSGKFGYFIIEDRFILEKNILKNGEKITAVEIGEKIEVEYNITPKNIKLRELYKGKESNLTDDKIAENINILKAVIRDESSSWLKFNDANTILKELDDITYTINKSGNKNDWVYESKPITVKLQAEVIAKKNEEDSKAVIVYNDVSLKENRVLKEQKFNSVKLEISDRSEIVKHGLYINNDISDNTGVGETNTVISVKDMNYTAGVVFNAIAPRTSIDIKIPTGLMIYKGNVYLYEVSEENGDIKKYLKAHLTGDFVSDNKITTKTSNEEIKLDKGKTYVILYSVNKISNSNSQVEAILNNGSKKNLIFKVDQEGLPELF